MKTKTIKTVTILFLFLSFFNVNAQKNKKKTASEDNIVTFYIARHGKTMMNTLKRAQGWADTPLTPQGIEVAEYLGKGLKDISFKAAYSSDLGRAHQTARIVLDTKGDKNMNIITNAGFREACFGRFEGDLNDNMLTAASIYMHYPSTEAMLKDSGEKMMRDLFSAIKAMDNLGMAENFDDLRYRTQRAFQEIAEKEAATGGGNILLTSHGLAIEVMLSGYDSKIPVTAQLGNASVSKVIYKNGKFTVESVGDMSYVEKGKKELSSK
ncbi:histidine phosphatase family protein [Flavobacterium sp. 140616W15]|uniref:histidine phosphatase family protein n=1 Tax=Flavobacterium sp. 140616W15 TaxID=2478552 RepID=UPI000F0CF871|nr:histidine phosphatase family protein [Flavobacterium sp. 140616W15]AYN02978.1 histidine phosphatase family protein [Flavobacterium sp. 140616W15]